MPINERQQCAINVCEPVGGPVSKLITVNDFPCLTYIGLSLLECSVMKTGWWWMAAVSEYHAEHSSHSKNLEREILQIIYKCTIQSNFIHFNLKLVKTGNMIEKYNYRITEKCNILLIYQVCKYFPSFFVSTEAC